MPRNLDLTALRAFATVAATGGVTRAAGLLNLTQSAVSMQIKRLEEALDAPVLERTGRGVRVTAEGEKVLAYARRMLALNDELIDRMREAAPEGEITLGVPHDIVPRAIPAVLAAFAAEFPRVRVNLISSVTTALHEQFADGALDIMVGTERGARSGGRDLVRLPLVWVGAAGGRCWQARPLKLAFEEKCVFRAQTQAALDAADIPWELALAADSSRAVDATVAADLACHVVIEGFESADLVRIDHGGLLPEIGDVAITLYAMETSADPLRDRMIELLATTYAGLKVSQRPSLSIAASG